MSERERGEEEEEEEERAIDVNTLLSTYHIAAASYSKLRIYTSMAWPSSRSKVTTQTQQTHCENLSQDTSVPAASPSDARSLASGSPLSAMPRCFLFNAHHNISY